MTLRREGETKMRGMASASMGGGGNAKDKKANETCTKTRSKKTATIEGLTGKERESVEEESSNQRTGTDEQKKKKKTGGLSTRTKNQPGWERGEGTKRDNTKTIEKTYKWGKGQQSQTGR